MIQLYLSARKQKFSSRYRNKTRARAPSPLQSTRSDSALSQTQRLTKRATKFLFFGEEEGEEEKNRRKLFSDN